MRSISRIGLVPAAIAALFAITAGSASAFGFHQSHPVFVQADSPTGNQVIAYDQAPNGTLTQAGTYDTGGLGGKLEGAVVDNVASQSALAYDRDNSLLYAVNPGSNSVSVFAVFGDRLALRQVIDSGGSFPASVAVNHGLVYVLNATAAPSSSTCRCDEGGVGSVAMTSDSGRAKGAGNG